MATQSAWDVLARPGRTKDLRLKVAPTAHPDIQRALDRFEAEAEAIRAEPDLTDAAKQRRIAERRQSVATTVNDTRKALREKASKAHMQRWWTLKHELTGKGESDPAFPTSSDDSKVMRTLRDEMRRSNRLGQAQLAIQAIATTTDPDTIRSTVGRFALLEDRDTFDAVTAAATSRLGDLAKNSKMQGVSAARTSVSQTAAQFRQEHPSGLERLAEIENAKDVELSAIDRETRAALRAHGFSDRELRHVNGD